MSDLKRAAEMALEALEYIHTETSKDEDELIHSAIQALRTALAQPEQDLAYQEAKLLAQKLYKRHYQHDKHYVSGHVVWKPLDTTVGVITQIDNMVSELVRPQPKQECVYPKCETAGKCDGPVAYRYKDEHGFWRLAPVPTIGSEPVYTAPPKREWVGLSNVDKVNIRGMWVLHGRFEDCLDETEAKLKEKNGYQVCPPCNHNCNEGRDCPARKK